MESAASAAKCRKDGMLRLRRRDGGQHPAANVQSQGARLDRAMQASGKRAEYAPRFYRGAQAATPAALSPELNFLEKGVLTERRNGLECAAPFDETPSGGTWGRVEAPHGVLTGQEGRGKMC